MFFKRKKKKGFTLVEILVSISILVTILAIVTKLLFDFSRSAYRVSFQIQNTETIRNIFRKLEKQLMNARAVIYQYDIANARSNIITQLKGNCKSQVSPFGEINCVNSGKLKSGNDMMIVSLPVYNRNLTSQSPEYLNGVGNEGIVTGSYSTAYLTPTGGIFANYPYTSLPNLGENLTSDPLDVNTPASANDVLIVYRDSKKNLRMYQLPSKLIDLRPLSVNINKPYSRYLDDSTYVYKGEILGSMLAPNIEETITGFDNSNIRTETPYDIFTYYTPTKELKVEPANTVVIDKGKLVPGTSTLPTADAVTATDVAHVSAIRIKLTKASNYNYLHTDPINTTLRPYEITNKDKKRIDEKTKETLITLNRSDTIN